METVPRATFELGKYIAESKIWGGGEVMLVHAPRRAALGLYARRAMWIPDQRVVMSR